MNLDPKDQALLHVVALRYLLAAEFDALQSLEHIEERIRAIDWCSEAFIRDSQSMRTTGAAPEAATGDVPLHPVQTIHYLSERCAEKDEAIRVATASLKTSGEQTKVALALAREIAERLKPLAPLLTRMRYEMEKAGLDFAPFEDDIRTIAGILPPTDLNG